MKTKIIILTAFFSLFLFYSCCDKCDLEFRDNERDFLPYTDNHVITFTSEGLSENITFTFEKTTTETDEKECSGFPERHCYLTLKQYGKSSGNSLGTDFELQISTFKEKSFMLSLQMVTSDTKYQYNGIVYSGSDVDNELIPGIDSLVAGGTVFRQVYKIAETQEPLVPETLNRITEFYFTKQQGLIRFKTKDGRTWDLSV